MKERKILQVATMATINAVAPGEWSQSYSNVFALADDGTLWETDRWLGSNCWRRVTPLPPREDESEKEEG